MTFEAVGVPVVLDAGIGTAGATALVKRLARRLLELDREIKDIDKTITERFREHPYARIIESLPGFGPSLGAEFLVATRGDLASFATAGRLASYAGLVPVPKDSAESPVTCVARNVTTADCDGCSTWPRCPAFAPTDPRAAFTIANARKDSSTPRPS
jgi:Transposase IS116/IS110/IS902 family